MRVAFVAILVLYVLNVMRAKPMATFGVFFDDGLYFSSAKALAMGQGYTLPAFPGHLPSLKYPEFYPLLLAGVWKLDPHFPGNVAPAVGLTVAAGCMALLFAFLLLREWPGLGDWPALAIVLLTGLCGTFPFFSALVASDVPFMAMMLCGVWLAERSMTGEPGTRAAFASGALVGMSVGLRSLGIPVAAGIGLLLLFRRNFRRLFWFCLSGLPLTVLWAWPAVSALLGLSPSASPQDAMRSGWTQTVCYYSSYACEWKTHLPTFSAVLRTIGLNLRLVAQAPGALLLQPLVGGSSVLSLVMVVVLSAAVYVGIVRLGRRGGWRPLHMIFPLYVLAFLAYPYDPGRFLLPFTPFFFAGLWLEARHFGRLVTGRLKQGCGWDQRLAAGILAIGGAVLGSVIAFNLGYKMPQKIHNLGVEHRVVLADEKGAFAWLEQHSAPSARVIAYEDSLVYLYTGRSAIRPIFTISKGFYLTDPRIIRRDAGRLADVARHIHASYWMSTPYDYPLQTMADQKLLLARQAELLALAPVVYRSADGNITLYDTRCLWKAEKQGCLATSTDKTPGANQPNPTASREVKPK